MNTLGILRTKSNHTDRAFAHAVLEAIVDASFAKDVTAEDDASVLEVLAALAVCDSLQTNQYYATQLAKRQILPVDC
jgi:hypothetical protein